MRRRGIRLLAVDLEPERLDERVAESDVRKPLPVVDRDEQSQMIELRTVGAVLRVRRRRRDDVTSKPSACRSAAKAPLSS